MKKFKLSVLFAALVSVFGLSSCLDSGDSSTGGSGYDIVRLNNFMGLYTFTTQYGVTLNPLNSSQVENWPTTSFAYIGYTFEEQESVENGVDVTLFFLDQIIDGRVVPYAPTEESANAGIYSLTSNTSTQFIYGFYQLNDMFLYVNFYRRDVDEDDVLEELNAHQFTLYYDAAQDFTNSSMTLHLRHYVSDMSEDDEFKTLTAGWRHFNLSSALNTYKSTYSKEPSSIIISYEQSTDGTYEENKVANRTAELSYTDAVSYYKSWLESQNSSSSN